VFFPKSFWSALTSFTRVIGDTCVWTKETENKVIKPIIITTA